MDKSTHGRFVRRGALRANHLTAEDMPAVAGQQIPSLNGLRAVSVTIVLLSHFVSAKLFPGGLGVYIFFVISGFLITRLLLAEGKETGRLSLPKFYARRAVRLLPVVVVYTIAVLGLYALMQSPIHWIEPAGALFYFANYVYAPIVEGSAATQMPFVPLWSLSIEEHFYFLLPAALVLLKRRPDRILWLMGLVCVACFGYRLAVALLHPELVNTRFFYYRTECRLDSLAYGVALAALCEIPWGRRLLQRLANTATLVAGLLVLAVSLLVRDEFFRQTLRYSIQGLAIAGIICAVVFRGGIAPWVLNLPAVRFVGVLSYSLYVWSLMAETLVGNAHLPRPLEIGALFLSSFVLAFASYRLLERPLVGLRHRLAAA